MSVPLLACHIDNNEMHELDMYGERRKGGGVAECHDIIRLLNASRRFLNFLRDQRPSFQVVLISSKSGKRGGGEFSPFVSEQLEHASRM